MNRLKLFFVASFAVTTLGCNGPDPSSKQALSQGSLQRPVETTAGGIDLKPVTVLDGALSFLVPDGFTVMDDEMLAIKYPLEKRPAVAYTDEAGSVNIAIKYSDDRLKANQLKDAHAQMDSTFRQMFPGAKWYFSGLSVINGREWIHLDLQTPAIDTEVRNMLLATSFNNRTLLITFNVTRELEEQWVEAGTAIIQSISVVD